ncbi:hypothetical protein DZG00_08825 [Clavibacter lycopersici]|uniref:Uncharacterized protein n=1 Tax=Clavibacter lycopersici TaxID=2301718 RepID=A0A399TBS9_9MICO|nr:hypothetical protein [Clavibacter lycopersici]RIJ51463.1 hypothetical protein DZG00_08825 [Clavibacter lycopersici]
MPVSVAPRTTAAATAPTPAASRAPLPGDPACVAFAGSADGFRHAGTRSIAIDLAPFIARARAAAVPLAA